LILKYGLQQADSGIAVPRDAKGYGLDEWLDSAEVGWDEAMQTYFLQCIELEEGLAWWLGTDHAEIPTFAMLCRIINRIFDDKVAFEFVDTIERP
jgi:hypothetical protein